MTPEATERYSRHIRLPGFGEEGQERLLRSHAVIVGCGALGSFQAGALTRAGVGRITIVDRDYVEWSNLQRQWLFTESDAREALPKTAAAANHLRAVNSSCDVHAVIADLTAANIEEICDGADVILDGTDNFETRYLLNDYAVRSGVPWIYGGAVGTYGITMPVLPGAAPCFMCIYPEPPSGAQPTCETAGVLNVLPSFIASIQAADALKILVGRTDEVLLRITSADLWTGTVRQVPLPERDAACLSCGKHVYPYLSSSHRTPVSLCGRNAVQIHELRRPVDLHALRDALQHVGEVRVNDFALRVSIAPFEMTVFPDGRAIIKGTTDVGVARSLYSKYIGN